jgi:hypothetical protein
MMGLNFLVALNSPIIGVVFFLKKINNWSSSDFVFVRSKVVRGKEINTNKMQTGVGMISLLGIIQNLVCFHCIPPSGQMQEEKEGST